MRNSPVTESNLEKGLNFFDGPQIEGPEIGDHFVAAVHPTAKMPLNAPIFTQG